MGMAVLASNEVHELQWRKARKSVIPLNGNHKLKGEVRINQIHALESYCVNDPDGCFHHREGKTKNHHVGRWLKDASNGGSGRNGTKGRYIYIYTYMHDLQRLLGGLSTPHKWGPRHWHWTVAWEHECFQYPMYDPQYNGSGCSSFYKEVPNEVRSAQITRKESKPIIPLNGNNKLRGEVRINQPTDNMSRDR